MTKSGLLKSGLKIGDIVRPNERWRNQYAYKKEFMTFLDSCYGIVENYNGEFSILWFKPNPFANLHLYMAWWKEEDLELVEACEPIWEKYI